jgi:GxxExxY protein
MTEDGLIEHDLTHRVIGCAMRVHREVGRGLREKTYERALVIEFECEGLSVSQQSIYPVYYRGKVVDEFIPDLIVDNRVVVEAKTLEAITDLERGQMLNYLRITSIRVGLIINFRNSSLEWERIVLESAR